MERLLFTFVHKAFKERVLEVNVNSQTVIDTFYKERKDGKDERTYIKVYMFHQRGAVIIVI